MLQINTTYEINGLPFVLVESTRRLSEDSYYQVISKGIFIGHMSAKKDKFRPQCSPEIKKIMVDFMIAINKGIIYPHHYAI